MADERERLAPVVEVHALRAAASDWRLSRGDVGVYASLLKHADAGGKAYPGPARMSREAQLAVKNVKASIARLGEFGYLRVEHRGLRKANHYHLQQSPQVPARPKTGDAGVPSFRRKKDAAAAPNSSREHPQSGKRAERATGDAGVRELGMPASANWGCRRDTNSLLNSPLKSHCDFESLEQQTEQQKRLQEQELAERLARKQRQDEEQRESLLTEYRQSLETHPRHARSMAQNWPWLLTAVDDAA